ncbi:unnamed protein product [Sphenostylis stenocarpa]|uniref:non-specific serine/threonine protein kinase n=1 Tax=Sphenostylis stenocarpa TaxID=92480 RepID=A0AA87B744_9FABA|nr:unnamed protein product [Sphenostylis stenocarpa]
MTNSFKNKLGQGGFGSVYKGKLHDGRVVAVKILGESKGNGEEFINEVASISRTSHVNIVRLLGFCFDSSKRALVYEFMPNGSLDKFIYEEKNPLQIAHQLDCKMLYNIAVGIARGLEYLHRGCNTRILHFDIKPHNILLDDDFSPKISDFGLAKICPRKESVVSISGARGTAGYIAPEVFSRNFGAVSLKSDVYSYGMMILEMVGRRKNIKVEVDRSSELYFPYWIYDRLESNQDLDLQIVKNESDDRMMRKMAISNAHQVYDKGRAFMNLFLYVWLYSEKVWWKMEEDSVVKISITTWKFLQLKGINLSRYLRCFPLAKAESKSKSIKQVVREWECGQLFQLVPFLKLVSVCGDDEFKDKWQRQLDISFSLKDVRTIPLDSIFQGQTRSRRRP